jgi:hypothetical protein
MLGGWLKRIMKQKREKDDKKFYVGETAGEGETVWEALTGCRPDPMQGLGDRKSWGIHDAAWRGAVLAASAWNRINLVWMPTINKVHIYEKRTQAIDQIILVLFLWGNFLHI